jgi:hypothetical protein
MLPTERVLCLKLLKTLHLSVSERAALPAGRARFSVLVEAVAAILDQEDWFPSPLPKEGDLGDGAVLESREDQIWVHEQHEIGVARFGPIYSYAVPSVADAVRAYVAASGGSNIDGVAIAWNE